MPLSEKALIALVRRQTSRTRGIVAGIGDDCAVLRLPKGHEALVTTDFTLEGVHFRREWHSPESVGHRCLARGLSDIAAMGGEPLAAFLSLALPRKLPQAWVGRFSASLLKLARRHGITLAGGDTAQSPGGILADIIVVGSVPKGRAILRSGARAGDSIYVTGRLGGSAAAVRGLMEHPKRKVDPRNFRRHFFPEPRVEIGGFLRRNRLATAMIDLSDGLSTDLDHICQESGVGAEVFAGAIPVDAIGKPRRTVTLNLALHGGEDYELLFTASARKRIPEAISGVRITCIGRIVRGEKMHLIGSDGTRKEFVAAGWEHFRS